MKRFLAAVLCLGIGILTPVVLTGCDSGGGEPAKPADGGTTPKAEEKPKDKAE